MKPSESCAIRALRSCMVPTTFNSVRPVCTTSSITRASGMMPMTSPPSSSAASATQPISPMEAAP